MSGALEERLVGRLSGESLKDAHRSCSAQESLQLIIGDVTLCIAMEKKRITVDVDGNLLLKLDHTARQQGLSRNRFILDSVLRAVQECERLRIDSEFAAMADDPEYCQEMLFVEREFAAESDRAWNLIDS